MKRKISIVVTLIMILGLGNVYAASEVENIGPYVNPALEIAPPTIEEQKNAILSDPNLSQDELRRFMKKFDDYEKMSRGIPLDVTRTNQKSDMIDVPYFEQETRYYCGPATVKQTLHYMNGHSLTQGEIAKKIGTTSQGTTYTSDMIKYLNDSQETNAYISASPADRTFVETTAEYACRNAAPAIVRAKLAKIDGWGYSSDGHYMNISGYRNYGSEIRITDPFITWIDENHEGSYYISSTAVYNSIKNHGAKEMIY